MVNTSFQFYKDNIPFGKPVKVQGKWDGTTDKHG